MRTAHTGIAALALLVGPEALSWELKVYNDFGDWGAVHYFDPERDSLSGDPSGSVIVSCLPGPTVMVASGNLQIRQDFTPGSITLSATTGEASIPARCGDIGGGIPVCFGELSDKVQSMLEQNDTISIALNGESIARVQIGNAQPFIAQSLKTCAKRTVQ